GIGTAAMIAAKLSSRADIRRSAGDKAARRRRTGGGPGAMNLVCLDQHQSGIDATLEILAFEDTLVSKESCPAILQGQIDRIGTDAGDTDIARRQKVMRRRSRIPWTDQGFREDFRSGEAILLGIPPILVIHLPIKIA